MIIAALRAARQPFLFAAPGFSQPRTMPGGIISLGKASYEAVTPACGQGGGILRKELRTWSMSSHTMARH